MKQKNGFSGERSIVLPKVIVEMEKNDPLVSSLYITDIGYYPKAENHYRERKEPIGENVLIYCMEGKGTYRVEGKEYHVSGNQYFILPAGKAHSYESDKDSPWTIYWIHFTGNHAEIYAQGAQTPQDVKPSIHSRINHRNTIFEEIFQTLEQGYSQESLRYVSSLLHYYLASMRYLKQYRETGRRDTESLMSDEAIHFMQENIEKKITLEDIAKYLGYSASHFSMMFKKQTGMSPLNYINKLKIKEACYLLKNTDMKINQICHKVGIEDCYYFSRLFSKTMGMSPKEYRVEELKS